MTTLRESSLSLVMTRQFLQELTQSSSIPESVREDAASLLRHFPSNVKIEHLRVMEERFFSRPIPKAGTKHSIKKLLPALVLFFLGCLTVIVGMLMSPSALADPKMTNASILSIGLGPAMMLAAGVWMHLPKPQK